MTEAAREEEREIFKMLEWLGFDWGMGVTAPSVPADARWWCFETDEDGFRRWIYGATPLEAVRKAYESEKARRPT